MKLSSLPGDRRISDPSSAPHPSGPQDATHSHTHHHGSPFRFCPKCGGNLGRTLLRPSEPARLVCKSCTFIFYDDPKVAACTIPVVDGKIVLLKRGIEPAYGKWVFPGGFIDRGERVQDAAVRETLEETGLTVEVDHLLNAYSYPGYPVVVLVYPAKVVAGQPQALDETLEVKLFAPTDIPWSELAFPSTTQALEEYLGPRTLSCSRDMLDNPIVPALKEYRKQHYGSDRDKLPKEVGDLVYSDPFAFLVGAVFDRGMSWKKAWEIPYWIKNKGLLDVTKLASMSEPELEHLLESLPVKPRYGSKGGAQTLRDTTRLVMEFGGVAAAIWQDTSPSAVVETLKRIRYVGEGIASMVVRVLHDDWEMFRGQEQQIDVKADVHVMRVFKRTGLTPSESETEAVNAARRLSPEFPGALDWPAWDVGLTWCIAGTPKCEKCPLALVCPKHI